MKLPDGPALEIPIGKRKNGGEGTQRWRFGHSLLDTLFLYWTNSRISGAA